MPIHVVDDEPLITEVVCNMLRPLGRNMHHFDSGESYLSFMATDDYIEPKLVITDVRMRGMDGFELIRNIRERGSKAKTIVMSGYHNSPDHGGQNICFFLKKPFKQHELINMVTRVLACECTPDDCSNSRNLSGNACREITLF